MYVGDEAFLGEMLNLCYTIKVSADLREWRSVDGFSVCEDV